ncbi:sensor histidine kinase [Gordonia terrae]|uniref:Histidine kinase n=2 Tax=Gordonia terrae TaxID=2055 RepID=A0AAD0NU03_9ACTN|nr:histidine kinase [Gordonia terrae]AWO82311.1 histidine kinase [Gordonia terrae]GAB44623.1 putative two-component histidine kinase [Gordonia terrae NBRC 100016]VTR08838.1 histidine kinase [Clostridioides difficile]VTS17210.1 Oxygen sensor histidine kinase nreB [Gordonia terrae]
MASSSSARPRERGGDVDGDDRIAGATKYLGLDEFADEPRIHDILIDHAIRGIRIQVVLRLFLSLFVLLTVCLDPPAHAETFSVVTAVLYAAWCVGGAFVVVQHESAMIRYSWVALPIDLLLLTALAVVASRSNELSWTTDVLLSGFVLVPMIAAIALQPTTCAVVVVVTTVVYAASSALARTSNGEPWSVIVLRILVVAALAVGAILLSRLQRSRVRTIGALAAERARLLDATMEIEERERRDLADNLHDGALQYVLAARQELATLRDSADPVTLDRVDGALRDAAQLLRSTLSELHPAVLEQAGLSVALTDLTSSMGSRAGAPAVAVDTVGWPPELRTSADSLLFATARELLTNVIKHAAATTVEVTAEFDEGRARLVVLDDGVGLPSDIAVAELMRRRQANGHIGLASRRIRIEGSGGMLSLSNHPGGGTVAIVEVPARVL